MRLKVYRIRFWVFFCLFMFSSCVIFIGCTRKDPSIEQNLNQFKNRATSQLMAISLVKDYHMAAAMYGEPDKRVRVDEGSYEVRALKDGSCHYVFYDKSLRILYEWRLKSIFSKEDFDLIEAGKSTYEDVQKIDPYCTTGYMEEGNFQEGAVLLTEHKLLDEQVVLIYYQIKEKTVVVSKVDIMCEGIYPFTHWILQEDLPKQ